MDAAASYWDSRAPDWGSILDTPMSPNREEIAAFTAMAHGDLMVLGATPALCRIPARSVTTVDCSPAMVARLRAHPDLASVTALTQPWGGTPLGPFDAIIGCGSLSVVSWEQWVPLMAWLRDSLRRGGRLALRVYTREATASCLPQLPERLRALFAASLVNPCGSIELRACATEPYASAAAGVHYCFAPERQVQQPLPGLRLASKQAPGCFPIYSWIRD